MTVAKFSPREQTCPVLPSRRVCRHGPWCRPMIGFQRSHIHRWQKLRGMWTWWAWWRTSPPPGFRPLGTASDRWHSGEDTGRGPTGWDHVTAEHNGVQEYGCDITDLLEEGKFTGLKIFTLWHDQNRKYTFKAVFFFFFLQESFTA